MRGWELQAGAGETQGGPAEGGRPGQVSVPKHLNIHTVNVFYRWVSEKSRRKAALRELQTLTRRGYN